MCNSTTTTKTTAGSGNSAMVGRNNTGVVCMLLVALTACVCKVSLEKFYLCIL
jgi:hypothetical protein